MIRRSMASSHSRPVIGPLRTVGVRWHLAVFVAGVALDARTTAAVVDTPGLWESNPLVLVALATGGTAGVLALKLVPVALVVGLFRLLFDDGGYAVSVRLLLGVTGVVWLAAGLWNALLLA